MAVQAYLHRKSLEKAREIADYTGSGPAETFAGKSSSHLAVSLTAGGR